MSEKQIRCCSKSTERYKMAFQAVGYPQNNCRRAGLTAFSEIVLKEAMCFTGF
jgi:hypothetical protein